MRSKVQGEAREKSAGLGSRGSDGGTPHPDQTISVWRSPVARLLGKQEAAGSKPATLTNYPFRSTVGRRALNAQTGVRHSQGVPNTVQWRNGNAAVCKTVMSRLDTGLHLQLFQWLEWIGIRLLSGHDAGSNPAWNAGHVAQSEEPPGPNG